MKQTKIVTGTERGDSVSKNAASRELDPVLTKFVEALAIADARRDHLAMMALRRSKILTQRAHRQDYRRMSPAAIYGRASTELQDANATDDQTALCRAY